jgi:NAD(P)-dependent dehydrogenase (short-subunit alcohol dehydrogenase family)
MRQIYIYIYIYIFFKSFISSRDILFLAGNFLAPVETLSYRAFRTVIEIDLLGTYNTTKACFPYLKKSKGCVINVSATLHYQSTLYQVILLNIPN